MGTQIKDEKWKIVNQTNMATYSLRNIFRLLWINKFHVSWIYIPRLLYVLWMSTITLPLRIIEKIRFHKKIKSTIISKDPIFIIGFYRTATTLLHILFSKDKRLGYMSNLDIFTALFNLSFEKISRKILQKRLPKTRPMDNIEMDVDGPQEESYAISTTLEFAAPNALIFPQNYDYFVKYISLDECPEKDQQRWKNIHRYFVQKTTLKHGGKQLVLKDPANSTRIRHLLKMYPNAKFIYTYRNPYPLLCSLKFLFQKLMELFTLQRWDEDIIDSKVIKQLGRFYAAFQQAKDLIPPKNFYLLKYEVFISNPLYYIEEIYERFGLDDFEEVKPILQEYLNAKKDYKANTFKITPQIIQIVNKELDDYRINYGYDRMELDEALEKL